MHSSFFFFFVKAALFSFARSVSRRIFLVVHEQSSQTQYLPVTDSKTSHKFSVFFDVFIISLMSKINILCTTITSNLSYISRKYCFSDKRSSQLNSCSNYEKDYWGSSSSIYLMDWVWSKISEFLQSDLSTWPTCLTVQSWFSSRLWRCDSGFSSGELVTYMHSPIARPGNIRQATASHDYCVIVGNSRLDRCDACFFPYITTLWSL